MPPIPISGRHQDKIAIVTGAGQGEWIKKSIENVPLKRPATPADIAVVFVCSGDADYITGQAINVDGGIEMN